MPSLKLPLFVCLLWSSLFGSTLALHVHRAHRHIHHKRLVSTTTALTPITSASSEAFIAEIAEAEQGLKNIEQDLSNFLEAVAQNLQQEEALLASLLASLAPTIRPQSLSVATSTAAIYNLPTPVTLVTASTLLTTSLPSSSLAQPSLCAHGGTGPLVPCTDLYTVAFVSTQFVAIHVSQTPYVLSTGFLSQSVVSPASVGLTQIHTSTPTPLSTPTPSNGTVAHITMTGIPQPNVSNGTITASATSNSSTTANATASTSLSYFISSTPSSGYVFNSSRDSNVAVYYGQTPATTTGDLLALCESSDVDIIILAFVTSFAPMSALHPSDPHVCQTAIPHQISRIALLSRPKLQAASSLASPCSSLSAAI